ncbi:MAG: hypothetical protein KC621_14845, partial [Myxococcales bacterium]|nr:hypothetical protein [Myxococcales bacterium]
MWMFLVLDGRALADEWTASWRDSRWHVLVEQTLPAPVELAAEENLSFRTRALQWEAILACDEVTPLGRRSAEVDCRFEGVSLRATPRKASVRDLDEEVLTSVVDRLLAARVRLGLNRDAGVSTVDLLDVAATTRRESDGREQLRRLVSDLVAPLRLAREADEQAWTERNTALVRPCGQANSTGTSRVHHQRIEHDGQILVESSGTGTFTTPFVPYETRMGENVPHAKAESVIVGKKQASSISGTYEVPVVAYDERMVPAYAPGPTTPSDQLFEAELTSVSIPQRKGDPI